MVDELKKTFKLQGMEGVERSRDIEVGILWGQLWSSTSLIAGSCTTKSNFKKVKPTALGKDRSPEDEMNPREVFQLRGLLGSLQWPAVQSSPHVQCSTSLISGSMSAGLVKSIVDANKLLKFCKENADVGARYEPLGELSGLRLVCMFDAAFGVRRDSSSQGGY